MLFRSALDLMLKQKDIEADAKIEMAFERVNNEINTLISKRTTEILQNVFQTQISEIEHRKIINNSLKNLEAMKINE